MVVIESEQTRVVLAPEAGAAIASYASEVDGAVLDWFVPRDDTCPGCFPMIPFASRIRGGQFRFHGRTITLTPNLPGEQAPIHGSAWQAEWQVKQRQKDAVSLLYQHQADEWPWTYCAVLDYRLDGSKLSIGLDIENQSPTSMPVGLGLHPYFPLTNQCSVTAEVTDNWMLDADLMPVQMYRTATNRWIPARETYDDVYAGWNGVAELAWPERNASLKMTASREFGHLVVYSPGGYFCAEPVSNMVDGFNLLDKGEAGHGVIVVEPGKSTKAWVMFAPCHPGC